MTGELMPATSKEMAPCTPAINYCSINYALLSTCYTALQIKNCSKSASAIKVATMKNTDMKGSHHALPPNRHLLLLAKMNGTQRRTLVSA